MLLLFLLKFKFGFVEEIQDTEIQDTRYKIKNASRRKGFCISCIFVSCNLYLTEKPQFYIIFRTQHSAFIMHPATSRVMAPAAKSK